ncbi:hypothetical protein Z043_122912 [Scleropages formosus]|uniref:LRRCT domain-containing protein n=1 Tax=Scleropages formosus TaxID=113540 RepID=A0A0N8JVV5_SCLFO|nr:hypothetical protein Z043_122912 [Scleropages formosus]
MFAHLPGLRRLLLANNSLVALHNGTFAGPERLEKLDLTLNAFRTFREEGLQELERPAAVRLLLAGNPYACSCELEDFAAWLNSSRARVDDSELLTCASPPALRDASVRALGGRSLACHDGPVGEGTALALQTSYAFLGVVLGFVGVVFLFVLYLNRRGIKKWIVDTRDACRDVLEGYHYRYEMDSDPRLGHVSTSGDLDAPDTFRLYRGLTAFSSLVAFELLQMLPHRALVSLSFPPGDERLLQSAGGPAVVPLRGGVICLGEISSRPSRCREDGRCRREETEETMRPSLSPFVLNLTGVLGRCAMMIPTRSSVSTVSTSSPPPLNISGVKGHGDGNEGPPGAQRPRPSQSEELPTSPRTAVLCPLGLVAGLRPTVTVASLQRGFMGTL